MQTRIPSQSLRLNFLNVLSMNQLRTMAKMNGMTDSEKASSSELIGYLMSVPSLPLKASPYGEESTQTVQAPCCPRS